MLTRSKATKVEIPNEPGEWAEIKPLSWQHKRDAELAYREEASARFASMAGLFRGEMKELMDEAQEELRKAREAQAAVNEAEGITNSPPLILPEDDPLSGLDMSLVLKHGLVTWSYPDADPKVDYVDLDPDTATFLAREIARLSTRTHSEGEPSGAQ